MKIKSYVKKTFLHSKRLTWVKLWNCKLPMTISWFWLLYYAYWRYHIIWGTWEKGTWTFCYFSTFLWPKIIFKTNRNDFFLRSVNFSPLDIQMVPYIHWSKFVDSNNYVPKTCRKNSSKFQKAKLEFALRLFM